MSAAELLAWLASFPPGARDVAIEEHLGIAATSFGSSPPGEHLIGYHPSGVAPIVQALVDAPVLPEDVVVDLGAGLGKVVLLTRLLTGATARGIELQPTLVSRAREAARLLDLDVSYTEADARAADLSDGTIFFLYAPFTGPALADVLTLLRGVAEHHSIIVCALGIDLHRQASWLAPRPTDAFWLTIYDSVVPGVAPARPRAPSPLGSNAFAIAFARPVLRTEEALGR